MQDPKSGTWHNVILLFLEAFQVESKILAYIETEEHEGRHQFPICWFLLNNDFHVKSPL